MQPPFPEIVTKATRVSAAQCQGHTTERSVDRPLQGVAFAPCNLKKRPLLHHRHCEIFEIYHSGTELFS